MYVSVRMYGIILIGKALYRKHIGIQVKTVAGKILYLNSTYLEKEHRHICM